jgi:hypothetical protein
MRVKFDVVVSAVFIIVFSAFSSAYAKEWQSMKSRHFIVSYRIEVPEDFVNTVIESAEDNYKSVLDNIGVPVSQSWSWEKSINLFIYRDQDDYIKNGEQAGWSHASTQVGIKTIRTYPSDQGFFDSLLPHELGHIVLHEYLGEHADIPLWFDEGVAMFQEKAKRVGANKLVKESLENGQFIPLTQLTDMRLYTNSDSKVVELFYAESASVVNFMFNELGRARFNRLCVELKEQTSFETALTKIYMYISNMDALNKKWVTFLKDLS